MGYWKWNPELVDAVVSPPGIKVFGTKKIGRIPMSDN